MTSTNAQSAKLTLGPLLFNWPVDKRRDFYYKIADEADYDTVMLGEVVCSKRAPFLNTLWPDIIERLQAAGKEVVFSTQALLLSSREMNAMRELVSDEDMYFEANDISIATMLKGRRHMIGPMMNVYNEGTLETLAKGGADRICLPVEMSGTATGILAATGIMDIETHVFGRMPLAIAARCYHARAHNLAKDSCQYVCDKDPDGMAVDTLDGDPFLSVNGTQTMSYTVCNLAAEIPKLMEVGVSRFRLSPHDINMVKLAEMFRGVVNGTTDPKEVLDATDGIIDGAPNSNGFFYDEEGLKYKSPEIIGVN